MNALTPRCTWVATVMLVTILVAPAGAQQGPTQAELAAASSNVADWLLTDHDYTGRRFIAATEITRDNVRSLRPVCLYQAGELRPFHTNPIVYRGVSLDRHHPVAL